MSISTRPSRRSSRRRYKTVVIDGQDVAYPAHCVRTVHRGDIVECPEGLLAGIDSLLRVEPELGPAYYVHTKHLYTTPRGMKELARGLWRFACDGRRLSEQEAVRLCLNCRWFDWRLKHPFRGLVRSAHVAEAARGPAGDRPATPTTRPTGRGRG